MSEDEYQSAEDCSDDEEEGRAAYKKGGYHPVVVGEVYKQRYHITKKLGWGHFSTVWLAEDKNTGAFVALKVVKSASHYTEAALDEIELLNAVAKHDPNGERFVVRLCDNFYHSGPHGKHVVMVFEVLGKNILGLIEKYHKGLPIPIVKHITKQILIALDFLHTKCKIIHTDLKPENVLLANADQERDNSFVKIADLGNACWVDKHFTDDIQTRQYRAPEVIIGAPYDTSADMWSMACMVFELATGDLLFKPKKSSSHRKSDDHLAMILELDGRSKRFPVSLLKNAKRKTDFFDSRGRLKAIKEDSLSLWPLESVLLEKYCDTIQADEAAKLKDFLVPMLHLDPSKRCSAKKALAHKWLKDVDVSVPLYIDDYVAP